MKTPCVIQHYLSHGEHIFVNTIDDASGLPDVMVAFARDDNYNWFIGFMTRKNLVEVFDDA